MNKFEQDTFELIRELNDEVYYEGCIEDYVPFEVRYIGFDYAIYFMGICLWSEENDEREWISDHKKEPMKEFILRESKKISNDLYKRMKEYGG